MFTVSKFDILYVICVELNLLRTLFIIDAQTFLL